MVLWVDLLCMIVVLPNHTHFLSEVLGTGFCFYLRIPAHNVNKYKAAYMLALNSGRYDGFLFYFII